MKMLDIIMCRVPSVGPWELSEQWPDKVGFFCIAMQFKGNDGSTASDIEWEGEEWAS